MSVRPRVGTWLPLDGVRKILCWKFFTSDSNLVKIEERNRHFTRRPAHVCGILGIYEISTRHAVDRRSISWRYLNAICTLLNGVKIQALSHLMPVALSFTVITQCISTHDN